MDATQALAINVFTDATPFSCFQTMWYANLQENVSLAVTVFDYDTRICSEMHFNSSNSSAAFSSCTDCDKLLMIPEPCPGMAQRHTAIVYCLC